MNRLNAPRDTFVGLGLPCPSPIPAQDALALAMSHLVKANLISRENADNRLRRYRLAQQVTAECHPSADAVRKECGL